MPKSFKNMLTAILFSISFCTMAADLPDPEVLAKQYLKDLCTLNEQDFTRKYMLTQVDAEDFIKSLKKVYSETNNNLDEIFSDSLAAGSEVHSLVVKSYKAFKEWQHDNKIDSSKLRYHSCEFKLEQRRKMPYYMLDDIQIYFSYDTVKYVLSCDDFLYIKAKWVAGDFNDIYKVDQYFNVVYSDSNEYVAADTVVVSAGYVEEGNYYKGTEQGFTVKAATKKQLKIQKKIDAYNRKIQALYNKQFE